MGQKISFLLYFVPDGYDKEHVLFASKYKIQYLQQNCVLNFKDVIIRTFHYEIAEKVPIN